MSEKDYQKLLLENEQLKLENAQLRHELIQMFERLQKVPTKKVVRIYEERCK